MRFCQVSATDFDKVSQFIKDQYGPAHYGADAQYMAWLYLDSPCRWFDERRRSGQAPVNAFVDDDGNLSAIHAYVPFDANTPWGGSHGIWDLEWINRSGVRGTGRRLAQHLLAETDIYVGFGCNDLSAKSFASMGMTLVPAIGRALVNLQPDILADALAGLGETPTLPPAGRAVGSHIVLDDTAAIRPEFLEAYAQATPFGVDRDPAWLAWRYDRHPYLHYVVISPSGAPDKGAAIVRLEKVIPNGFPIARMLEFFPRDPICPELADCVIAWAAEQGAVFLDYFTSSEDHVRRFETSLAAAGIGYGRNPRVPFMTQPLTYGETDSINMVIGTGGRCPSTVQDVDFRNFHSGKGDANQDVVRRKPETC